jgi:Protein of unknown function (DUF1592)/Protein of unknown function (DUF1588)/Protein of unknown function (DUF1587)/Protein of unknown function (DUF1595)/Protein of unknown function (DUF1585)
MEMRMSHRTCLYRTPIVQALVSALWAFACGGHDPGDTTTESSPVCGAELGPAPLRRITRFEYGRTVADLAGVDSSTASSLLPDEQTLGFDDIATAYSVSALHAARYLDVAEQVAAALVADGERLSAFAGCDPRAGDAGCVDAFVSAFGRRAFRRPLVDDEKQAMLELYADTADPGPAEGVSAVVAALLESPQFLYRPEAGDPMATAVEPLDGYALATRVAYLITGAGPDQPLLEAAEAGKLDTDAGLFGEADRLLETDRARELFVHFASQWWEVESVANLEKDRSLYRRWTDTTPAALAEETRLFLSDVWQGPATLSSLLTAPVTFVNAELAAAYGLPVPGGTGFGQVTLDPLRAAGMLSQGSFLAAHAKADQTSPVLRGKFVRSKLFCTPPPPPPPSIVVSPPTVDPRLSTRQRFAQHTVDPLCASCHTVMDPIGFAFEHYDATGRWRDIDGGQVVDASGTLSGTDVDGALDGVPSLATRLARSTEVSTCAATQWFRYAFGRSEQTTDDTCTIAALSRALSGPNGDFKHMMRETVRLPVFRNRAPETEP